MNKTTIVRLIALLVLIVFAALPALAVSSQQEESIPLIIGFYGKHDTPGALGMQVALAEMDELGPFLGADGLRYHFVPFITEDVNLLAESTILLVTPASPEAPPGTVFRMPVFMLSNDAPLQVLGAEAAVFRAMTPTAAFYDALANFSVTVNTELQRVTLIGDGAVYKDQFDAFQVLLQGYAPDRTFSVQALGENAPTQEQIAEALVQDPQMIVYYGTMLNAGNVFQMLSDAGWSGAFVYEDAYEAAIESVMRPTEAIQIAGMTSWVNSMTDTLSQSFRLSYISRTGRLPNAVAVSAYDITWAMRVLIQRVGSDPATLVSRMPLVEGITTTQGNVNPQGSSNMFSAVVIYQLAPLGGMEAIARYDGGVVVTDEELAAAVPTPLPLPTTTPGEPVVTVLSNVLNVRSGPGLNYTQIGQLREGDQAVVIGTIPDFSWFYVQTPNGLGWVTAEFVELFVPNGDINSIALVSIPPSPTPGATATPDQPADLVIDSVTLNPPRVVINQSFTAQIVVRNAGVSPADGFAVGAVWQPGNVGSSVSSAGLAPFNSVTVFLTATVTQPGKVTVEVRVDANNQITESNENNNNFPVTYVADAAPINSFQATYPIGQHNFAGSQNDLDWTGADLVGQNGAVVGIISGIAFEDVHVGLLKGGALSSPNLGTVAAGTIFGLRTGEGHCGVFRIENVVGGNINLTYRMYSVGDCA